MAAEQTISNSLTQATGDIDAEAARAKAAEAALQAAIDAESARAKAVESTLDGKIQSELTQRVNADSVLSADQAAETAARKQGDADALAAAKAYADTRPGEKGDPGASVTAAQLLPGDPNCPFGGTQFVSASGVNYACNGAPGSSGSPGQIICPVGSYDPALIAQNRWDVICGSTFGIGAVASVGGMGFDGTNLWVGYRSASYPYVHVAKVSPNDGSVLAQYELPNLGNEINEIVFDGTNMWAAMNFGVVWFDRTDGRVLGTFPSPPGGGNTHALFDGTDILILSFPNSGLSSEIKRVRTTDGSVVNSFSTMTNYGYSDVPATNFVFDGNYVWTGDFAGYTKWSYTGAALQHVFMSYLDADWKMVFDGESIWGTSRSGEKVARVHASSGLAEQYTTGGNEPYGLGFDGSTIWVADFTDGTVSRLRIQDGSIQATYFVGNQPLEMTFDGQNMWVLSRYSKRLTRLPVSR